MTAPNEITPAGFLSATGLAAFAAKTREDWETEQRNAMTSAFTDAQTGFGTIKDWIDILIGLLPEEARQILTDLLEFFGELINDFGDAILPILNSFTGFLSWLWGLIESVLGGAFDAIEDFLKPVFEFFINLFDSFGDTFLPVLTSITGFLTWLWGLIESVLGGAFDAVEDFLKPVFEFFVNLFDAFGDAFLPIVSAAIGFLTWLWGLVESVLGGAFDAVEDFLKPVIELLVNLFDSFGATFLTVIQEIVQFFSGIFTGSGSIGTWLGSISANLISVVQTITGQTITSIEDGISKLTQFTQNLPSIGTLISGLMGTKVNPVTGTNTTLPDLIWWASQLLLSTSVVPSWNLFGSLPEELLALIGAGSVSDVQPNLVNDASFSSAAAFQAGQGWSWDGATNSSGSTGGSAKLTCDGGVKYLFSNLIPAAPGQQVTVSANVKYTKGSSASATIIGGVRTYNGDSVIATTTVASLAATGTSGGFTTISGVFTVPASTTHVRLVLGVTVGTAGTIVWFDEVSLKKASTIPQTLVGGLGTTLSGLLPTGTFNALLNAVANKTGATVAEVTSVINGKLDPNSTLNGNKILQGNISSAFIGELLSTWGTIKQAVDGGSIPGSPTYTDPADALKGWGQNIVALQSSVTQAVSSINSAVSAANAVALRATNLETRTAALEQKVSLPVVPPVTPPIIVSVLDDFERSTLGANWTVSYSGSNGSTLGIPNAHDAQYSNPAVTSVENKVAAIWAGTGSASTSEYQKIYTTLGSRAGVPAIGTVGFNDLIGRAVNGQRCLVCRFFGNGQVQFLYRMNSWTDVLIGTFSIAIPPTTGTGLEFYCGDKSVNDQTKLYAKIGSTIIGPAYVSPSVLASMGKGWGFGMGHGLAGLAPQAAGIINYWGAQEQV